MPDVVRLFIKTSLIYFVLTFLLGALLLTSPEFVASYFSPALVTIHVHMGTVGWLGLMVMGVAYWMFPLDKARFKDTRGRYHKGLALTNYWLVNGGLILRIVVELFPFSQASLLPRALLPISAVSQAAGGVLFLFCIWSRIRGFGE
ncbi:MAG: hypothetical protein ACE5LX_05945 [Nitrospinota bacterium]